jgi:hypothetical protein
MDATIFELSEIFATKVLLLFAELEGLEVDKETYFIPVINLPEKYYGRKMHIGFKIRNSGASISYRIETEDNLRFTDFVTPHDAYAEYLEMVKSWKENEKKDSDNE